MTDSPKHPATSNSAGGTQSNRLETWGSSTTMNLNNLLYQNIQASAYFKSLYAFKTYHEVIEEAKARVKQVNGLLKNPDSPYVRALGFLYLRYVCQPSQLWDWYVPFLDDPEEVTLCRGSSPKVTTIDKGGVALGPIHGRGIPIITDAIARVPGRFPANVGTEVIALIVVRIMNPPVISQVVHALLMDVVAIDPV
ncbi:hypothetical protein IWQ61_005150 [Dispira simplex]|nr:hypothetical protein IWQ61_005150 [Dispira simplex]